MHFTQLEMMTSVVQAERAREAARPRRTPRRHADERPAGRFRTLAGRGLIGTGDRLRSAGSRLTGATA